MGRPKANLEVPTRRLTSLAQATQPLGSTHPMMNAVGGSTYHWTGRSWRYHPWNFKTRSETLMFPAFPETPWRYSTSS